MSEQEWCRPTRSPSLIHRLSISVAQCWRNFVYNLIASHLRKPILRNIGLKLAQPGHGPLFFTHTHSPSLSLWLGMRVVHRITILQKNPHQPSSNLVLITLLSIWSQKTLTNIHLAFIRIWEGVLTRTRKLVSYMREFLILADKNQTEMALWRR